MTVQRRKIDGVPTLILRPKTTPPIRVGVLWLHGGGYMFGAKEMVYLSAAPEMLKGYGATIIAPGYRLSWCHPYPAAVEDSFAVLHYVDAHKEEFGIDRIMIGGESAGGGLTAALCMMARDNGIHVSFQMPLYPMLNNADTDTSRDNHARIWNTRWNHLGWKLYLRKDASKDVSPYAAPARQTDYKGLPPCYTFVGDGDPFLAETLAYVQALQEAGIEATVDVYPCNVHGFDELFPGKDITIEARRKLMERFAYALQNYD